MKKIGFVYLLDLFGERVEKEWCGFVCLKRLYVIELIVVLFIQLMSFSRMVSMVLVLRGDGPIQGNGYGI